MHRDVADPCRNAQHSGHQESDQKGRYLGGASILPASAGARIHDDLFSRPPRHDQQNEAVGASALFATPI